MIILYFAAKSQNEGTLKVVSQQSTKLCAKYKSTISDSQRPTAWSIYTTLQKQLRTNSTPENNMPLIDVRPTITLTLNPVQAMDMVNSREKGHGQRYVSSKDREYTNGETDGGKCIT